MKSLKLENLICKYGSPMGRSDMMPENRQAKGKLQLAKMKMYDGACYDEGGAYWGCGEPLYHAEGELSDDFTITRMFIRAKSRQEAKRLIRLELPNVSFYR